MMTKGSAGVHEQRLLLKHGSRRVSTPGCSDSDADLVQKGELSHEVPVSFDSATWLRSPKARIPFHCLGSASQSGGNWVRRQSPDSAPLGAVPWLDMRSCNRPREYPLLVGESWRRLLPIHGRPMRGRGTGVLS